MLSNHRADRSPHPHYESRRAGCRVGLHSGSLELYRYEIAMEMSNSFDSNSLSSQDCLAELFCRRLLAPWLCLRATWPHLIFLLPYLGGWVVRRADAMSTPSPLTSSSGVPLLEMATPPCKSLTFSAPPGRPSGPPQGPITEGSPTPSVMTLSKEPPLFPERARSRLGKVASAGQAPLVSPMATARLGACKLEKEGGRKEEKGRHTHTPLVGADLRPGHAPGNLPGIPSLSLLGLIQTQMKRSHPLPGSLP